MKNFYQAINSKTLSPKEKQVLDAMKSVKHLKKEELFINRDQLLDSEVFIEKGVVRAFIVDDCGNEKTIAFFEEGEFMNSLILRSLEKKSLHYYQALCQSTVIELKSAGFKNFMSKNKQLSEIGKQIKEKEVNRLNKRDQCILQVNAIDKYQNFLLYFPNIEKFVSQKHVASYLGITPVSLSRTKSKLVTFDN